LPVGGAAGTSASTDRFVRWVQPSRRRRLNGFGDRPSSAQPCAFGAVREIARESSCQARTTVTSAQRRSQERARAACWRVVNLGLVTQPR
jgi:ribulose 1,5-bisphosphate carboxylase large subunit-like protein